MGSYDSGRAADFGGISIEQRTASSLNGLRFDSNRSAPTSANDFVVYRRGNALRLWDGTSETTLGATGAVSTTLDSAYNNGPAITIDTDTIALTQTLNNTGINLNKTGTGAGTPLLVQNAGSGDDIQVISTRGGAAGIIIDYAHNSATPAAADVIFEEQINGLSSTAVAREFGRIRFIADDVTNASEDTTYQLALMIAGTERTVLAVTAATVTIGSGAATATLDTSGANDLILQTNAGTNSGTIRIFNGANGNIEVDANGTGDLTLPSTGIVQGGTAATRCTFAVAGTTGAGFSITTSTITSGDVVRINHSASATLAGGNLLALQIDGTAYYSFGEFAMTILGTAGQNALAITNGDVQLSAGGVTVTKAANNSALSVTNNTATTASVVAFAGSGVFTGTGATSFLTLTPSGLTTGTAIAVTAAALTSGNGLVVTVNAMTTGLGVQVTTTGTLTGAGAVLDLVADSATTAGASAGQGLMRLSADGLTTGTGLDITSTSAVLTSGEIANFEHIVSSATLVAKTGQLVDVTATRTNTALAGTVADDYDALSVIRSSTQNGVGGTLTATGSVLYVENQATQTAGTLTDTVNGIEVVMDTDGTGQAISVTHNAATVAGAITLTVNSITTGTGMIVTANGLTTGTGLRVTSSGTITTTGELLDIIGNSATTTTGLVRVSATGLTDGWDIVATGGGANATALGGVLDIVAGAATLGSSIRITNTGVHVGTTGVLIHGVGNSATTGDLVSISGTGLTTGNCIFVTGGGANMTAGGQVIDVVMGAATVGQGLRVATSGVYTGTTGILDINATAATTGVIGSIDGTGLTTGTALELLATAATLTTGAYLRCNDGGVNVFAIGLNGHIQSRQTTAPTIATTVQNGITAAAISAGSTDTIGTITTTGTSTGSTQLTVTFNKTYAIAPKVFLVAANAAAEAPNTNWLISSTTATTFVITVAAGGTYAATPSWNYFVVEMGS